MSIKTIIKFKQICDHLSIDLKIQEDFEKRLIIQKVFYFLNKMGLELNTKFNFYKYGPYSPDLTDIYYSLAEIPEETYQTLPEIELKEEELEILQRVKNLYVNWGKDLKKFEFLASVLYIYKDMYIKNKDNEKIKNVIMKLKPDLFTKYNFEEILEELRKEGFIEEYIKQY
ncbi:MAG: hypothetical protein P8Y70_03615 [Candidatus Lokiarchaeota archaeon]